MTASGITIQQANEKIRQLRSEPVIPPFAGPEDLDRPLDPDIRITAVPGWGHKIDLMVGGVAASWHTVVDMRQQVGSAVVRMGGIAHVGTHDEHRFKGYSRRVMENSLRWQRQNGYGTSMLYGITRFYPKYGFAEAFPGITFTLSTRDAELVPAKGCRFVDYAPAHLPAVLRMYQRNNAGRTGPTLRDRRTWQPWRKGAAFGSKAVCRVALDADKKPVGYVVLDDTHLTAKVIEVGYADPSVFGDLACEAARRAWDFRLAAIALHLPADSPFIDFLKPFAPKAEIEWRKDGGAMVRMINIASALTSVGGELAGRMRKPGALNLRTNLGAVRLQWSAGRMKVGPASAGLTARMPQWALAQLLYGYRQADVLAAEGVIRTTPRSLATLAEMFPPRPHYHYSVDHF